MQNKTFISKAYFLIANFIGFFILLTSCFNFYSSDIYNRGFEWIISFMLGCFIVFLKNLTMEDSNFKSINYYTDTIMILLILVISKYLPVKIASLKIIILAILTAGYLSYFSISVLRNKVKLKDE